MQDWASKFYHSQAWLACRRSYIASRIQIDGGLCEHCHRKPGKIVHHKVYLTRRNVNDPTITLNHRNLEYVVRIATTMSTLAITHRCAIGWMLGAIHCPYPSSEAEASLTVSATHFTLSGSHRRGVVWQRGGRTMGRPMTNPKTRLKHAREGAFRRFCRPRRKTAQNR